MKQAPCSKGVRSWRFLRFGGRPERSRERRSSRTNTSLLTDWFGKVHTPQVWSRGQEELISLRSRFNRTQNSLVVVASCCGSLRSWRSPRPTTLALRNVPAIRSKIATHRPLLEDQSVRLLNIRRCPS